MPDDSIVELAKMAGVDPVKALGEYHFEWLRKKKAVARASGVLSACLVTAVITVGMPDNAYASKGYVHLTDVDATSRTLLALRRKRKRAGFAAHGRDFLAGLLRRTRRYLEALLPPHHTSAFSC